MPTTSDKPDYVLSKIAFLRGASSIVIASKMINFNRMEFGPATRVDSVAAHRDFSNSS